jgi:hypothetical protein
VASTQKRYRIPRIQSTELKKANKLKGPSKDVSIPLGREKKAITGSRGGGAGGGGGGSGIWVEKAIGRGRGEHDQVLEGCGRTGLKPRGPANRIQTGNLGR